MFKQVISNVFSNLYSIYFLEYSPLVFVLLMLALVLMMDVTIQRLMVLIIIMMMMMDAACGGDDKSALRMAHKSHFQNKYIIDKVSIDNKLGKLDL